MVDRDIRQRLATGRPILLDGATGSELQHRGVDLRFGISDAGRLGAWSAIALRDAPDVVRSVHDDYLRVGAEIVTTNSFWTNRVKLGLVGLADKSEEYTRVSAELAVEARDTRNPGAFVAGGMAPPQGSTVIADPDELMREFSDQARVLAEAGVDFLLPEYLGTIDDCVNAFDACAPAGLPVMLGLRHVTAQGDMQRGESFEALIAALAEREVACLLIMCSDPDATSVALAKLRAVFAGPIGAYPNVGYHGGRRGPYRAGEPFHVPDTTAWPPVRLAQLAGQWLDSGVSIIGGCCATSPEHIALMRRMMDERT